MPIKRNSGYTLIEVVLASGLFVVAMTGAALVSRSGSEAQRTGAALITLEQSLHHALERVSSEIVKSGTDFVDPTPVVGLPYSDIDYQAVTGMNPDGTPATESWSQLVLELGRGEFDDGLDNDGDGLVDEQRLVLVRSAGGASEQRVILCKGISEYLEGETFNGLDDNGNGVADERGFHLEWTGTVFTIRITAAALGPQGQVLTRTAELDTRMRN